MMPAKFAHQQQVDIIDMARSNVAVSSCLRRLGNWCPSNGVDVEEGKQALSADFQQQVLPQYVRFFRQCLEAMYVCGFIPWYTSELDGTRFPVVLPLGSFTWTVEQTERYPFVADRHNCVEKKKQKGATPRPEARRGREQEEKNRLSSAVQAPFSARKTAHGSPSYGRRCRRCCSGS